MREGRSQHDDMEEREMEEGEGGGDVFEMLKTDHRRVQDLFTKFEDADKRARASIAEETLARRRERPWPLIGLGLTAVALAVLFSRASICEALLYQRFCVFKPSDNRMIASL